MFSWISENLQHRCVKAFHLHRGERSAVSLDFLVLHRGTLWYHAYRLAEPPSTVSMETKSYLLCCPEQQNPAVKYGIENCLFSTNCHIPEIYKCILSSLGQRRSGSRLHNPTTSHNGGDSLGELSSPRCLKLGLSVLFTLSL